MQLIQTATLSTDGIFDLQNIPQTYNDLKVVASIRRNSSTAEAFFTLNWGLESALHRTRILSGTGSSTPSATYNEVNGNLYVATTGTNYTANTWSSIEIYISNYTSTSSHKTFSFEAVTENNSTASYQIIGAGLFQSNNAVTKILLDSFGGTLVAGSTVSLYGITRGSGGATVS
jgi:hypothetical protein